MPAFYRIVQSQWSASAMSGEGARRFGGRWNAPGVAAVYLAESRALTALEIIVHAPREVLRLEWRVIRVDIPDQWIEKADHDGLPKSWRDQPSSVSAQKFGSTWLQKNSLPALMLPSVIVPEEHTLLLDPSHPDVSRLKVSPPKVFSFDPRL
jgi:RES domain-containing protein